MGLLVAGWHILRPAFAVDAHPFGLWCGVSLVIWLRLRILFAHGNVPRFDVDMAFVANINSPSAAVLEPGNDVSGLAI